MRLRVGAAPCGPFRLGPRLALPALASLCHTRPPWLGEGGGRAVRRAERARAQSRRARVGERSEKISGPQHAEEREEGAHGGRLGVLCQGERKRVRTHTLAISWAVRAVLGGDAGASRREERDVEERGDFAQERES